MHLAFAAKGPLLCLLQMAVGIALFAYRQQRRSKRHGRKSQAPPPPPTPTLPPLAGQSISTAGPFLLAIQGANGQVLRVRLPQLRNVDLGVQFS